ncbi:enoyl-CoA hydratase [Halomonas denitrificans]|uniref:enoyl-CoA hydratase n=1 Tax=Halomonas TaxID=2745 RepID=UPI001C947F8C|nr:MULTISPECIES: enoyl-CoA hydratase [Halomonas]MED5294625.1 enoyl-CoA hydratase [Pseudomonadota bacterium]MBY5925177.1 enoyl-CoA hydratase [Halomonas sp. DP4Y7-2]MBY5983589.1 enoyl-CoA hydratase [Halomonas sp. DP5Y7-2]MBY6031286.1 enoyl-CoA hydratase [Halomonas sp. DP8Y7-1]MBY6206409.1 enoyl-CoA hydratase [Halomonas sp. DP3Y7-2]
MSASPSALPANDDAAVVRHDDRGIVHLTLNRPASFNALSQDMLTALDDAFTTISPSPDLRAVVIAAEGRAFCAGHDLKEMRALEDEDAYRQLFAQCSRVMQRLQDCPVPVIARVQGLATAAGCQLVASCDMAVASSSARFAVSGINVGLFCSTPAVALTRNIGPKQAAEMLFTGDFIDAEQALAWGLINRVAEPDALDDCLEALLDNLRAKSQVALFTGKSMLARQRALPLGQAYAYAGEVMAANMMAEDVAEGIDAFVAKRRPRWTHR